VPTEAIVAKASYATVKSFIREQIASGVWPPGTLIPSESQLMTRFSLSRMTVNRALRELTTEGLVVRTQGVGSFVAELTPVSSLLQIRDIREEVHERGHQHRFELMVAVEETLAEAMALRLELPIGSPVFFTLGVHFENDVPVQVEERWVNPHVAPSYLATDFRAETPSHYLLRTAPILEAELTVEAKHADPHIRRLLRLGPGDACLIVGRRTWSVGGVATFARLTHPGNTYRLVGRFKP
jgi:GntR family histidine utilization transcriptional repressor